ncbi:MAG: ABC transporter permease, partial [Coriobacteriales bacterium]|nr:ABC transporter permease [Coriobacteriales bacterium]
MASAFGKDLKRSIRRSLGRFIAIAVIAALGTGFYAGLRMTSPDMYYAADTYYDAANACDLNVVSTLGLDDESVEELRAIEGIEQVEPGRQVDVLANLNDVEYPMRVHSFNVEAARASDTSDGLHAISDDLGYLNRPLLVSGSWPEKDNQCVVCADAVLQGDVKVGDKIRVTKEAIDDDADPMLTIREFEISGFVRTPYYPSSPTLGTTTLGDGDVADYMLVFENAFDTDLPYTNAFITVEGARELISGTDEYDDLVGSVRKRIDDEGAKIAQRRHDRIVADAQAELDDGRREYEDAKRETLQKLDDAQSELNSAKSKLDSALAEVASAQSTLDDSAAKLRDAEKELDKARKSYDQGLAKYQQGKKQAESEFAAAQSQFDAQAAELAEAESHLPEIEMGITKADEAIGEAVAAKALLEQQLADLDPDAPGYETQKAYLESQIQIADEGLQKAQGQKAQLEKQRDQIVSGRTQLDQAQATLNDQKAAVQKELAASKAQLDSAKKQIEDGAAEIAAGWKAYEEGVQKLADGKSEYESGKAQYDQGLSDFLAGKAEADEEFAKAEQELADAQEEIDSIRDPEWYTLDRSKNPGAESYRADSNRIDKIARVFPFIFFLVAALVSLTTMTRMVDEERVTIGTYKALGYSDSKIISKYLLYALLACGIGCVVGIVFLTQFLPFFIMNAYAIMYQIPCFPTPIDPQLTAMSCGLSIAIIMIATWWAAYSTLRERAAQLMLPRAPKAGKRIILERIGPLWRHMSFSWKVTARNIFRYKKRFFMAIIGIAGCTALLLTGFGLNNSINDIIDKQFGQDVIIRYAYTVQSDEDADEADLARIERQVSEDPDVSDVMRFDLDNMVAATEEGDEYSIVMVCPTDPLKLDMYYGLRERLSQTPLAPDDDEVVVSEKIASQLGIEVGDDIRIYERDNMGNALGKPHLMKVGGICENYVDNYVFATPASFEKGMGEKPEFRTFLARSDATGSALDEVSGRLLALDDVSTVSYMDDAIAYYRKALKSVDAVVIVLIVAAAALAFVVVYNLANINIAERQREIAPLKVLGFTRGESV